MKKDKKHHRKVFAEGRCSHSIACQIENKKWRFWDYRPFTRVVESLRAFLNLRDYVRINTLEGNGVSRSRASYNISRDKNLPTAQGS